MPSGGRGARLDRMPPERPPIIDAEYRVIHGPWPRWMLQLSLFTLIAWGAGVVGGAILLGLVLLVTFGALG